MTGSFVPLPMLDLVASLGGVLAVAGLAYRWAHRGTASQSWRGNATMHTAAGLVASIGAAGAFWLGGDALIVLFAAVSALAFRDFAPPSRAGEGRALVACCYGCVPFQFGALAAGRLDLAQVTLPLLTALALPLLALIDGGTRNFVAHASKRCWSAMAYVYCMSFVPALLLLDGPAFEDRNAALVAFVVALSLAAQALQSWPIRLSRAQAWAVRASAMLGCGAALAWMTPFPVPLAAALALVTAIAGWIGASLLTLMRHERMSPVQDPGASRIVIRPDALVFMAPLFFAAMRVLLP